MMDDGMTTERLQAVVLFVLDALEGLKEQGMVDGEGFMVLNEEGRRHVQKDLNPSAAEIAAAVSMFRQVLAEEGQEEPTHD